MIIPKNYPTINIAIVAQKPHLRVLYFNPKAAEVLLDSDREFVIRQRTADDMIFSYPLLSDTNNRLKLGTQRTTQVLVKHDFTLLGTYALDENQDGTFSIGDLEG